MGWPWGLPFWPLHLAFGPVIAWNLLLIASIALAGLATYGWLRLLDLPVAAALAGGLAFAIAPYRLAQSGGHLLGWAALFVPACLWAFERSRAARTTRARHLWGALAAVFLLSIPLCGQVHLALAARPSASPTRLRGSSSALRPPGCSPQRSAASSSAWPSRPR